MELARVASRLEVGLRTAFGVVVMAALVVDLWVAGGRWTLADGTARPTLLILAAVASIGVAWAVRPRWALGLAIAASVLSLVGSAGSSTAGVQLGLFTELVVFPVLLAAVLSHPGVVRWPIAALVMIAGESIGLRTGDTAIRAIIASSMLVLFGAAVVAVVYIRLRDSERRASVEVARYDERLELAREVHDVVGHHVTGIVVLAQASRFTSNAATDPAVGRALAEIEAAGSETLSSLRTLIGVLRTDPSTAPPPRLTDIERSVEHLRRTHPSTDLTIDESFRTHWLAPTTALTVQRLLQESVTNVRRHGDPAAPVRITLAELGGAVELTVENRMLHAVTDAGFGVVGMRERVDALGGRFTAGPTGTDRWTVRATLPDGGGGP